MARRKLLGFIVVAVACGPMQTLIAAMPPDAAQAIRTGNYAEAHRLLLPLARDDDTDALYQLGRMHQLGLGVSASAREALKYYRRAAEGGHVEAAFLVGHAYETGSGAEPSQAEATYWYDLAASEGHERAAAKARALRVTPTQAPASSPDDIQTRRQVFAMALNDCDATQLTKLLSLVDAQQQRQLLSDMPLALHRSIDCGQIGILEMLVEHGGSVKRRDGAGNTPLHLAVARGETSMVRALLRNGASPAVENDAGWTPRMLAERSGDEALQKMLGLRRRASSANLENLAAAKGTATFRGWSTLAIAAWKGDIELLRAAIDAGTSIDETDGTGHTPLARAIESDHADAARLLLGAGARATDPTLIHLAVDRRQSAIARMLIDHGVGLGARDKKGEWLLHKIVRNGDVPTAAAVVKRGVDVDATHENGQTALMLAARDGNLDLVQILISGGADMNVRDSAGCTALCWAIKGNNESVVEGLLSNGASNIPDSRGNTPMMMAAGAGYLKSVQMLGAAGVDPNEQSGSGSHALLLASSRGHVEVVQYLVDNGSKVDLADNTGDTALIIAVRNDQKSTAAKLLALGASANARNNQFESAKTLALAKAEPEWEEMFEGGDIWTLISGRQ